MPANYLHGVETIEVERSGVPVKIVKSGVVGLTGSSAITTTKPVLCLNQTDDAQFGTRGTIPTALKIMRRYCNGAILVISQPLNATPVDIIGTVTEVAKSGLEQLQDSFN
ncbi:MAG: phage tail sheath family protein, partial [Oceanospirillaceae bacterium]|nr:phage tail sheath family protein [Oceanospirillaceae bacterium]